MDDFDYLAPGQQRMLGVLQHQLDGVEVPDGDYILAGFPHSELRVIRQFIKSFHEGEYDE